MKIMDFKIRHNCSDSYMIDNMLFDSRADAIRHVMGCGFNAVDAVDYINAVPYKYLGI